MPPYIWIPPVCLGAPHMFRCHLMFGCPPYVWLCHCMFGCCHTFGIRGIQTYWGCPNIQGHLNIWSIQMYGGIWTPPQSDKACLLCDVYVQQASKHLPYIWGHPNIWKCLHLFGGHPNIGVPKCNGESIQTYGASKHRGRCPNMGGIKTYRGLSKHMGHPNIQGVHPNK